MTAAWEQPGRTAAIFYALEVVDGDAPQKLHATLNRTFKHYRTARKWARLCSSSNVSVCVVRVYKGVRERAGLPFRYGVLDHDHAKRQVAT